MASCDPIGFFDSGVGGLTVMREALCCLPHENMVYLGDTARLPYGNKSPEAILRFTLENVSFLLNQKIKLLIIACFTASSYALEELEQRLSIPVIGVGRCGLQELMAAATRTKRIGVLGTSSTIKSGILQSHIVNSDSSAAVFPVACSLFVPFIEEGLLDHPALRSIAHHYLDPLKKENIDAALLACTHYPLIRPLIQEILGSDVQLIEPARSCAMNAKTWLTEQNLLNIQQTKPSYQFYVTDDPAKFHRFAVSFFGEEIGVAVPFQNLDFETRLI